MIIGIPREILSEENRVAATPDMVSKYIQMGFEVWVESGAGQGIFRPDSEYAAAGARVVAGAQELLAEAQVVLKVKQPVFNEAAGRHEADILRDGGTLITFLHPAAPDNHEMVFKLRDKNITALTMDGIPRISRAQRMDALSSMSSVTGYKSVEQEASYHNCGCVRRSCHFRSGVVISWGTRIGMVVTHCSSFAFRWARSASSRSGSHAASCCPAWQTIAC